MKVKHLCLAIPVCFLMSLAMSGMASAATNVEVTWENAQGIDISYLAGDDASAFVKGEGVLLSGTFTGHDFDDNPYTYNVDTVETSIRASVVNGWTDYRMDRDASWVSMYGEASQRTYSFVGSSGTASLATQTSTNYANMKSCNYGFQSNNHFQASGDNYYMEHDIWANVSEGAGWSLGGNGASTVNNMSDGMYSSSFNLGQGCGCYTNASVNSTGNGTFELLAQAANSITTNWGINMGGGTLDMIFDFVSGFSFGNFALSGN